MSTVDNVQDNLDSMILTIFDAVRNQEQFHLSNDYNCKEKILLENISNITNKYNQTKDSISNLIGANLSDNEQNQLLNDLSNEYNTIRQRILTKEKELHDLTKYIDEQLLQNLSDATIGCRENN